MEFTKTYYYVSKAITEAYSYSQWEIICEANLLLHRISRATGNVSDLIYYNDQVRIYADKCQNKESDFIFHITQYSFQLYLGLEQTSEGFEIDPLMDDYYSMQPKTGYELYMRALYIVQSCNQYYPAISYIDNALRICQKNGLWSAILMLLLLQATVYNTLNKNDLAAQFLVKAYLACEGNNIIFPFVEYGESMVQLLEETKDKCLEIKTEWIDELSEKASYYQKMKEQSRMEYLQKYPYSIPKKINKLNPREFLALRYACRGLSTEQIAFEMNILESSVYTYLHNSYRKLGANDRNDAVRIALTEGIFKI